MLQPASIGSGLSAPPETLLILREWDEATPTTNAELRGINFNGDVESRNLASQLYQFGQIEIIERIDGLLVRTNSFVGSIHIGQLHIIVQPKLTGVPLLNLLRYAYGLRRLDLFPIAKFGTQIFSFQDLLIYQLIVEVKELLSRGLIRQYICEEKNLSNPSGRISFRKLVRRGGMSEATIPCVTYRRLEDCIHNQILLAGLKYATWLTEDLQLRSQVKLLARIFELSVTQIRLDWALLENVNRESSRLTASYEPAITIIELLLGQHGIEQEPSLPKLHLKGFLFDMNRFFQALTSRFLRDYLEGFNIEDERRLLGMMAYVPGYRLNNYPNPVPRPDFAVTKDGKTVAILDAKYRDLWEKGLPREMLYQLSIYALSQGQGGKATIIFPVISPTPRVARLQISDAFLGGACSEVIMQPFDMLKLDSYLRNGDWKSCHKKALEFVFG